MSNKHFDGAMMMLIRQLFLLMGLLLFAIGTSADNISNKLEKILLSDHREKKNLARDRYRHPKETLAFFGLQGDMKVLEISPGRGWYTEILAPLLRDEGELTVASFGAEHPVKYLRNIHIGFIEKMDARSDIYAKVKRRLFEQDGSYLPAIQDASMDRVVTFRNTHNWIQAGRAEAVYRAFARVLKPGGVLGVVQHRAAPGAVAKASAERGYVPEAYVIELAEQAGLKWVKKSEINANLKDTKDYPEGVWSLPPTYRKVAEADRAKYQAIGESDRMTMLFVKPR